MKEDFTIHICISKEEFAIARSITQDYMKWLGMDLDFQNTKIENFKCSKICMVNLVVVLSMLR